MSRPPIEGSRGAFRQLKDMHEYADELEEALKACVLRLWDHGHCSMADDYKELAGIDDLDEALKALQDGS